MTYQCRIVLHKLKKLCDNTEQKVLYGFYDHRMCLSGNHEEYYDYSKYENEIDSILSALQEEGYLKFTSDECGFQLTQKAIHSGQLTLALVENYLLDNWIAILALIVAIIALFK